MTMERIILHIDVNNAFLSWSAIYLLKKGFKYDIRNRYAVIGGDKSKRSGIVLAKSTLAKKKGVVTAETIYSASRKCPNLEVYPSNYDFYSKMSKAMFKILSSYTNEIEIFSIDECFLDYTNIKNIYGDEVKFAYKIQKEIYDKLSFTVNIGVANNKLCAKMASDFEKPFKVHTLYDSEIKKKMYPLDVGELFGIGKKTAVKLRTIGINKIGDLAESDVSRLSKLFKNQAYIMVQKARGVDSSPVVYWNTEAKGIGNEITLKNDIYTKEEVYPYLLSLADHVGYRIRKENKFASVISVTLKDYKFKRFSHQQKLANPTSSSSDIYKYACNILNEMWNDTPIRLIGIRLDKLTKSLSRQLSIFEDENNVVEDNKLNKTLDNLKSKYGKDVVLVASLKDNNLFKKRLK